MMSNEKLEVIDIDDKKQKMKNEEKKEMFGDDLPSKRIKKRRLKKGIFQTIFCLVSFIFIIGCCFFYGSRLVKYYKIYNPKSDSGESIALISNALIRGTPIVVEGSGIYRENGLYVYKGADANNYIKFSNLLWRIVRTNSDGSLEIILDDAINALAWDFENNSYIDSDIHQYLNDVFLKKLDIDYLTKTNICTDPMEEINQFVCKNKDFNSYVKLLPANDFLNSIAEGSTYIANSGELIWLGTRSSHSVWHTNGENISDSDEENTYLIKPVVTIKSSTLLLSGNGTKDDPFIIEQASSNVKFGSYIKLGNDTWVVYEQRDNILQLAYATLYAEGVSTYRFDLNENGYNIDNDNSLANLLNNQFYESLSYKDILLDFDIYTGEYVTSYKDVYESKVTAKVGILNVSDLKINSEVQGYYLSTKSDDNMIYYYRGDLVSSKVGLARPYRPTISIKIPKISSGSGTIEDPFIAEVDYE